MYYSTVFHICVVALSGSAIADSTAVINALTNVNTKTQELEQTVQSWSGDVLGSLSILANSASSLLAICEGREAAEKSAELTTDEALSIATAVSSLATTVNTTMTAIIDAHEKFEDILVAPVVLLDLKAQKKASDEMSTAIIAKVPSALQAIAKNLVAPIDSSFTIAIDAFSIWNGI